MFKKLALSTCVASLIGFSTAAHSETVASPVGEFDVSMNVALTTDYMFRGISQTQNDGAIQGGLDVVHDSGLYAGVWGSNVDFGGDASVEFDYYAGFSNNITDALSYDVGWIKYDYPGEAALNFSEFYGSLSAYGFTVGVNYSDDFADDNTTLYSYLGYEYALPYEIGLGLQVGNYDFKDPTFVSNSGSTDDSYVDWSVGLSKTLAGIDFGLTYTDTNLSSSECANFAGDSDYCDASLVLSLSKTL